jgi:hypothetical protein
MLASEEVKARPVRIRPQRASIAIALLLVVAACADGGAGQTASTPRSASRPPLRVSERQNGKTVSLRRGQRLLVVLHSTYWKFQGSSNRKVLRQRGAPSVEPALGRCVPGGGCGTVTASFLGAGAGSASVTATRTSCGEALGCTASSGRYAVRVVVSR